jgi:catechol 2,3-dioxygenase-like lactoylglutathione lyase family enzyme
MVSNTVACLGSAVPILSVKSLSASLRYYTDVLGFKVDWTWGEPADFASVSRDGVSVMFCEQGQGQPGTWVWIGVDDVEALHREYTTRGATFREPPTRYPWAYEMKVTDPDGHVLRFGSDPEE